MSCVPVCDGWRVGCRGAWRLRLQERRAGVSERENQQKPIPRRKPSSAGLRSIPAFFAGSEETGLAKSSGSGQAGAGAREGGLTRRLLRS